MARTMRVDSIDIYRAVVDVLHVGDQWIDGRRVSTTVYGPHDNSQHARSWNSYWDRDKPTRMQKQKLTARYDADPIMFWNTVKTTYTNGGEDVNWDEGAGV